MEPLIDDIEFELSFCANGLGRIRFDYSSNHRTVLHSLLRGHGVKIYERGGHASGLHGEIHCDIDTLIWGDGGSSIDDGDVVYHDSMWCRLGLEKAR